MPDLMIPTSPAALAAAQSERRRAAFERAKTAPFYAGKLDHIDPEHVTQAEEWAKIPVLDKAQLRALSSEDFYEKFCIAPRDQIAEFWRSGGSTGRPLFYPRTRQDLDYALMGFKRVLACAGFSQDDITHLSLPLGIHPAGQLMGRAGSEVGCGVVWAGGGNTLPSAMQLELMRLFQPTAWIGMASYGLQLANLARAEGFDLADSKIGKVLCTAEPLSDTKRGKLGRLFGAEVRDCFGMTEMMMLGCEDAAGGGFRFWSDFVWPEVIDEATGEPVPEGEPGLLVVTSLVTNNATPFIRWNTGDIVTMRAGDPQGSAFDIFPLVRHTHRTAGFVKVRGVNVGFTEFEDLMFALPQVADFRVEITAGDSADNLELYVEYTDGTAPGAEEALCENVRGTFEIRPVVHPVEAGSIAQSFEGAFKPQRFMDRRG